MNDRPTPTGSGSTYTDLEVLQDLDGMIMSIVTGNQTAVETLVAAMSSAARQELLDALNARWEAEQYALGIASDILRRTPQKEH